MNIFIATKPLYDTNQTIVSYRLELRKEEYESYFHDVEMPFALRTTTFLEKKTDRQEVLADTIQFLIVKFFVWSELNLTEINIFVNSTQFDLFFNSKKAPYKFKVFNLLTKEEIKKLTYLKDFFTEYEISPSIYSHTYINPYDGEIEDVETIFELLYADCGRLEELFKSSNKSKN